METVATQEITCIFQSNSELKIYDQDHWNDQNQQNIENQSIKQSSLEIIYYSSDILEPTDNLEIKNDQNRFDEAEKDTSNAKQNNMKKNKEKLEKQQNNGNQKVSRERNYSFNDHAIDQEQNHICKINEKKVKINKNECSFKKPQKIQEKNISLSIYSNKNDQNSCKKVKINHQMLNNKIQSWMNNPKRILKEGFLTKKNDSFFTKWHKRYLVLTPEKLYCFQNQQKNMVVACYNIKLLKITLQYDNLKGRIILKFEGEEESLILKSSISSSEQSAKEVELWHQYFKYVIEHHCKHSKLMLQTLIRPQYSAKDTLTERQFLIEAETGDILLFNTNNTAARLQRTFTSSEYDHVAMIIKHQREQLYVFQANQMYGVSMFQWSKYIAYFNLYEKVALRKLHYKQKLECQQTLLEFVKKNIGKNYQLNLMKLLKFQSDFEWQNLNKEQEDRGYFCSELIAKALKSVGLLDEKRASGRYWPVDFTEKSELSMKKNASFGHEQTIILNKHQKKII